MQQIRIPKPKLIEVSQLRRNPKNIKQHPEAQIHDIVELIKMVGFKDPIVIDAENQRFFNPLDQPTGNRENNNLRGNRT